jgi:hypothetical protein
MAETCGVLTFHGPPERRAIFIRDECMWGFAGVVVLVGLVWKLARNFLQDRQRKKAATDTLFAEALTVLENPAFEPQGPQAYPRLRGTYRGFPVQVLPVVDTLATRRLPALWMLVTLQDALPVKARFDMMMRPTGATTFSNFDHLTQTLKHPAGFPEQAVIRTDDAELVLPAHIIRPHLALFFGPQAKELLVTENGLRLVWLLAEAERARYGIFRQAEFGEVVIDAKVLREILDTLLAIRTSVGDWAGAKP